MERIDLENYDKCRELKNPFKRKQRLILIKSQKSGNKVMLWRKWTVGNMGNIIHNTYTIEVFPLINTVA